MSRTYRNQPDLGDGVYHPKYCRSDRAVKTLFKKVAHRDVRLATEIPDGNAYKKLTNPRGFSDLLNQPMHHFG